MIIYILKSILCSGLLLAVYFLFLQREKTFQFNRFYLLITLPLALIFPLITIELSSVTPVGPHFTILNIEGDSVSQPGSLVAAEVMPAVKAETPKLSTILVYGYMLVCFLLLIRFLNNLFRIIETIRLQTIKRTKHACLIVVDQPIIPHTFLHYVFIGKADAENNQILTHEFTHASQKHSLDILFIELAQCLLWINPFIFLYKRAIKLNHEFIADDAVVHDCSETSQYQKLLLIKSTNQNSYPLASSFSYSLTKKRFIMMTTSKNQTRSVIKMVMTSILLLGTVLIFSEKVYAQNDSIPKVITQSKINPDSQAITEFDTLISKIIQFGTNKAGKDLVYVNLSGITDEQRNKAWEFYNSLTDDQKSKYPERMKMGIKFAFSSPPPPQKQSPTAQQMADFADPKIYGVWLDGKRVSNTELAKYKPSDIALVWTSRLMKNAAHYGQYKFQVDLMTQPYFDKTYPPKSE